MKKIVILFCVFISLTIHAFSQNKVVIQGVAEDPRIEKISLWKVSEFPACEFNHPFVNHQRFESNENNFYLEIECDKEQLLSIAIVNYDTQRIYVTPGDTVFFKVNIKFLEGRNKNVFEFSGKNASQYNFDYQKSEYMESFLKIKYEEGMDYMSYKNSLQKRRDEELRFLESYNKQYGLSAGCYHTQYGAIINKYIVDLYSHPQRTKDFFKDDFPCEYKENVLTPIRGTTQYHVAMKYNYINSVTPDVFENIETIYQAIISQEESKEKEFLYALFLGIYAAQRDKLYADFLLNCFKNISLFVKDISYLDYIKRAEEYYSIIIQEQFPDEVLDNTFLKEYDSDTSIPLRQILEKYKGEALYIDFWASWCSPCRADIRESEISKQYLQEKGIRYLYFSAWDKEEEWQKAIEEDKINKNQYLIQDSNDSPLLHFLSIKFIPHYILLNKDHVIYSGRAPRPTPYFFEDFKTVIEKMDL